MDALGGSTASASVLGYHYPENRDMLLRVLSKGTEACFIGAWSADGELQAVLPGMLHRAGGRACYNSLPFFGPNAGVLASAEDPARYAGLARALTLAAVELARGEQALSAVFYSPFNPEGLPLPNPALDEDLKPLRVPRTTLFTSIGAEAEWAADIRYDIRKAEKAGVTVQEGIAADAVGRVYEIYAKNCADFGIPLKPRECIEHLCRFGGKRVAAYTARLEGEIIAALIVLRGPRTASYYLPCGDSKHRALQAGSVLIERAVRDARDAGLTYWNWEASPDKEGGVYRFKRKWGAQESGYEVSVVPLVDDGVLKEIGSKGLADDFPFYFVYPYAALQ
ncbi:MAG: GNAT family N-acetyltransferase [Elusimicrobia bacterium]|nr:GNAT family N-acetyltransferase [Elusimicrobiota bacterium]